MIVHRYLFEILKLHFILQEDLNFDINLKPLRCMNFETRMIKIDSWDIKLLITLNTICIFIIL